MSKKEIQESQDSKEKVLEKSKLLKEFPTLVEFLIHNKEAKRYQNKKNYYKNKYKK